MLLMGIRMNDLMYYAHSKEGVDKSEWQPLIDHLTHTADLAFALGDDAGVSELARVAGRLHDIGKYSLAFQHRLEGASRPVSSALGFFSTMPRSC